MRTETFELLFREFLALPKTAAKNPTLQEIAGFPHYENVVSNILTFFFDTEGVHGFKDLMLKSLLSCAGVSAPQTLSTSSVEREVSTENGKRIDLVLCTDDYLIGIENKIFHTVQNDLADYARHLQTLLQQKPGRQPVNIVLGLHRIADALTLQKLLDNGFVNVSYSEFFTALKNNLGHYLEQANPDFLLHLKELIRTIENLISSGNMNSPAFEFFKKYEDPFLELSQLYHQESGKISQQVRTLQTVVETMGQTKLRIYKNFWLYWYSGLNNKRMIGIEAEARFKGWFINFSVRDPQYRILPEEQLIAVRKLGIPYQGAPGQPELKDGKIILETLPLDTPLDVLAQKIIDLIRLSEPNAGHE